MPTRVYIATPSHDHKFHAGYALSLIKLINAKLYSIDLAKVGGTGVARARNNMAQEFLASAADVYFAIDADISFEPEAVARIVEAAVRTQSIVCGLYALKQEKIAWCVNVLPGEQMDPETYLQKVACSGTGFMCVPRVVFERMIAAHPEIAYDEDIPDSRGVVRWDFFSMGVVGRRYLTEDWYFCHRARALGFPVYVDASIVLKHEGMINFPLPAAERERQLEDEIEDLKRQLASVPVAL